MDCQTLEKKLKESVAQSSEINDIRDKPLMSYNEWMVLHKEEMMYFKANKS